MHLWHLLQLSHSSWIFLFFSLFVLQFVKFILLDLQVYRCFSMAMLSPLMASKGIFVSVRFFFLTFLFLFFLRVSIFRLFPLKVFNIVLIYCCSAAKWCPRICDPIDCSTPGFFVLEYLLEFAQTYVHWVGDAIQPSHSLLFPSPPAFSLSQHKGLFNESALCISWPKYYS